MIKAFSDEAWEDYTYWETQDKKTLKRIHKLINDIDRNGYDELMIKTVLFIVSRMVLYKSFSAALITVMNKAVSPTVNSAGDFSITGT